MAAVNTLSRRDFALVTTGLLLGSALVIPGRARAAGTIKVALLLPGSIQDGGWNQLAYQGLQQLTAPGFQVAHSENVAQAQSEQATRGYADDGYDLIIGHSYEYGSAFTEIAPSYPKIRFFASTFKPGESEPTNAEFIDMAYLGAAYGAGALAALISAKQQSVGFVGGGDNPTQQAMRRAFIAGAEHSVPGIKGLGIVTGDYNNAAKGREAASTMIGNGADVIWHAADVTGLGAMQGAAAAKIKAIGCYSDQTALAPEVMATSFMLNLPWIVTQVAKSVADCSFAGGEWKPPVAMTWLPVAGANGTHNPKLVTDAQWTAFTAIWNDVNTGKIDVAALIKT